MNPLQPSQSQSETARSKAVTLKQLNKSLGQTLPRRLIDTLYAKGIHSLEDIRKAGGGDLIESPSPSDAAAIKLLEAHANLVTVSSETKVRTALIDTGLTDLSQIVTMPKTAFVAELRDVLGEVKAAAVYGAAVAQSSFLNSVLADLRTYTGNGLLLNPPLNIAGLLPAPCGCADCNTAVSPRAYLVDLLRYATRNLERNGFQGQYFGDAAFSPLLQTRIDRVIRFDWSQIPPTAPSFPGPFSVRWTGQIQPRVSGTYTFYPATNNGRLYVWVGNMNQYLIGVIGTGGSSLTESFQKIDLIGGRRYDVKIEYSNTVNFSAAMQLSWAGPNQPKEIIPERELHSKTNIDVPFLVEEFRQPFDDLPGFCDLVDEQVPQGRICIEVLRGYLASKFYLLNQPVFQNAYKRYLLDTYQILLTKIGTSYEELRLSRASSPAELQSLADRLGVDAAHTPAVVKTLLLDPPGNSNAGTYEQRLEQLFGLADTTRDPLSTCAKIEDSRRQLLRWRLQGVRWNGNTDDAGVVHVSLKKVSNTWQVGVYKDAQKTIKVASGQTSASPGKVALAPVHQSGLSGEFDLHYSADTDAITIQAVPAFLSWQLRHLRTLWKDQDYPAANTGQTVGAIIDPDVITLDFLRNSSPADAAVAIWQTRHTFILHQLDLFKQSRAGAGANLAAWFATAAAATLGVRLDVLDAARRSGSSIQPRLDAMGLAGDAFLYLLGIQQLLNRQAPILDAEWDSVDSIFVQVRKNRAAAEWRHEEGTAGITLSPDFFRIPTTDPTTPPAAGEQNWRASTKALQNFTDTLQSRIDQEQALIAGLQAAVATTETDTLPKLRDSLLDPLGTGLSTQTKWAMNQFRIDTQAGGCRQTTRVAQAIETLQDIFFSARIDRLDNLTLPPSVDSFDEEWKWMGSFEMWRAAMLVFLYPENVLQPGLRKRQTPAFSALIQDLRSQQSFTPAQAKASADSYSQYFKDVCTLQTAPLETYCATDDGAFQFFFARSKAGRLYWSFTDTTETDPSFAQSFWDAVPGLLDEGTTLAGAVIYSQQASDATLYLFARTSKDGAQKLVLTRYGLESGEWDASPINLSLPNQATSFTAFVTGNGTNPPGVWIHVTSPVNGYFQNTLNNEGNDWVSDFTPFSGITGQSPATTRNDIAPVYSGPFDIGVESLFDAMEPRAFDDNMHGPASSLTYFEEAWYFVPMKIALQLQASGQYTAALDWFRTVYDYDRPDLERKVYEGLKRESSMSSGYRRATNWLLDPLNPHSIAAHRANTYTRYTLLAVIQCLLDFADAEFTRDTAESISMARILYVKALDLLDAGELNQSLDGCDQLIGTLNLANSEPGSILVEQQIKRDLKKIGNVAALKKAIAGIGEIWSGTEPLRTRFEKVEDTIAAAAIEPSVTFSSLESEKSGLLSRSYRALFSQAGVADSATQVAATFMKSGGRGQKHYFPDASAVFCVPPNPMISAARLRGELNLYKLRNCRNIAGMKQSVDPYSAPLNPGASMPAIGSGGQLVLPGTGALMPLPYRYSTLVDRAKQLVQLASQTEAAMLAAIEKSDIEAYNLMKAKQDVSLAHAGVQLKELEITEAQGGVKLARLQQERAQLQVDQYQQWLDAGLSDLETENLNWLGSSYKLALQAAQDYGSAAGLGILSTMVDVPVAIATGGLGIFAVYSQMASIYSSLASQESAQASARSTQAAIAATRASYERRAQEWAFQRDQAQQDVGIGAQQVGIAQDRVQVAAQDRTIAQMQADHADAVVNFLSNKFTSAELYDWMSSVLQTIYTYLLQQATAMAKLAENQLAFERQETAPSFIQDDYWQDPSGHAIAAVSGGQTPDRRGLTGSARLLQDLIQLDQYAFTTDKRKLQLSKTISLAQLDPFAFQLLRSTGVMTFNTTLDMFDRDFPGHYLRLIQRVRTTVVALIPPAQGIRATLTANGLSRVVIGGGLYQQVVIKREPQQVALSSPFNSTGLFDLDPQSGMLLPFEGLGVDVSWEFRMPMAANPFDFSTIADVLITIEYTALNSFDYAAQVIRQLNNTVSADRAFSFRQQFADQWYDLHNPDQTTAPMVAGFSTRREDYPANMSDLRIQQVVMYFVKSQDQSFEVQGASLLFTPQNGGSRVGGQASSVNGLISTRSGSAGSWMTMIGQPPFGDWQLSLPDTPEMRRRFENDDITDILFVVTFTGRTPAWPT